MSKSGRGNDAVNDQEQDVEAHGQKGWDVKESRAAADDDVEAHGQKGWDVKESRAAADDDVEAHGQKGW